MIIVIIFRQYKGKVAKSMNQDRILQILTIPRDLIKEGIEAQI